MSGELKIRFAADMPPAAVEVVSPELASVGRVWLTAGSEKAVQVPSEESFLRVHLASGRIVNLTDQAGLLDRTIDASMLADSSRAPEPTEHAIQTMDRSMLAVPTVRRGLYAHDDFADDEVTSDEDSPARPTAAKLNGHLNVSLTSAASQHVGEYSKSGDTVTYRPREQPGRYVLTLDAPIERVRVRLPGSTTEIVVRSIASDARPTVSVRVKTDSAEADALSGYLHRGDLYSASSMSDWAERAEDMLAQKMANPFAATVGAYLLLRLRRTDLLHDWTKNLANWFDEFSDPLIIRAWHLVLTRGDEAAIRDLFNRALHRSLPVFSEGLRLLGEGVRLLGKDSDAAVETLNKHASHAVSTSPFTATVDPRKNRRGDPRTFDINYLYDL